MEVYVTRGTETEVRAYEGEVESLTSADSSGVGIRLLLGDADAGGSQVGFAWAGSLEPDVIAATLADARDNARFATPDPDVVLAAPDGVEAVETGSVGRRRRLDADGEEGGSGHRAGAGDPGRRPEGPAGLLGRLRRQPGGGGTGLDHRHHVVAARRTNAFLSVDAIAGDGAESQTGTGFSVGRGPADLDAR